MPGSVWMAACHIWKLHRKGGSVICGVMRHSGGEKFLRELLWNAQPFPAVISAVKQEHSHRLLRCMALQIWPFGFKRIFILAQTGLRFNPEVLQVPLELRVVDEGWTVRWCDTRGLVCVLKPLLFLFFVFMRNLAVTQRSILGWQEFSALSIGPRDACLAVVAFQIRIGVHERRGCGSGNRLQATWRNKARTGWSMFAMEIQSNNSFI